jgi:hypothetical protein
MFSQQSVHLRALEGAVVLHDGQGDAMERSMTNLPGLVRKVMAAMSTLSMPWP